MNEPPRNLPGTPPYAYMNLGAIGSKWRPTTGLELELREDILDQDRPFGLRRGALNVLNSSEVIRAQTFPFDLRGQV